MSIDATLRAAELTVQQIRIFCEVFDRAGYSEAARHLGTTPPALWSQVRLLERRYGVALFRKVGRCVASTPEAEQLREAFRPLLAGLASTFDLVGPSASELPRTIRLVSGMRMALEELGAPVAAFRKRYPNVCLRWLHADNIRSQQLVDDGKADLAVMLEPTPEQRSSRLEFDNAYRIEFLAVLPVKHCLAKKRSLRLRDLTSAPLIVGHGDTVVRKALEFALHQRPLRDALDIAAETDNSALTVACVRQGMGVGIIAGRPNGQLLRGLHVRPLGSLLGEARIVVAWKRGTILSQTVDSLKQMLCLDAESDR
jgi:DNA-binding transcriptional LysR family regulator